MPYTTPQLDCAEAVAALLDGEVIAGFTLRARADDQDPVYEKKDLAELKVCVLIGEETELEILDRGTANETCPIVVGVHFACELDDEDMKRRLLNLLREIALVLRFEEVAGFGYPVEPVTVSYSREQLRRAIFSGVAEAVYRVQTEAAA